MIVGRKPDFEPDRGIVRSGDVPAETAERTDVDGGRNEGTDVGKVQGRTSRDILSEVDRQVGEMLRGSLP